MLDIARTLLNNAIRPRPIVDLAPNKPGPKATLKEPWAKPTHYYDFSTEGTVHPRAQKRTRSASNPSFVLPVTRPVASQEIDAQIKKAARVRQRKVTFAVELQTLLRHRAKSENDPSHKGISKSMQLWRATAQISPSASDDSSEDDAMSTRAFAPCDASSCGEEVDWSPPLQFATAASPPSLSQHIFTANSPSIYSISSIMAQDHTPIISLVPQLIDRATGAIFETISEGRSGPISLESSERLDGEEFILRYSVNTPTQEASTSSSIPSLALTIPTPNILPSPVFHPQSPFTLSRFIVASNAGQPTDSPSSADDGDTPLRRPVPSLPRCRQCRAFTEGGACSRACQQQLLACRVWYQAHDGGHRRHLTEPYIRPGESTMGTRAMIGELGLPVGSPRGLGLDLADAEPGTSADPALSLPSSTRAAPLADVAVDLGSHFTADVRRLRASAPSRFWNGLKNMCRPRSPSAASTDQARVLHGMAGRTRSATMEVLVRTSSIQTVC